MYGFYGHERVGFKWRHQNGDIYHGSEKMIPAKTEPHKGNKHHDLSSNVDFC
jgi:hypothetical protein